MEGMSGNGATAREKAHLPRTETDYQERDGGTDFFPASGESCKVLNSMQISVVLADVLNAVHLCTLPVTL